MKTPSDIKTQVVQVCETLHLHDDMELKKITGRLVAKETDFSHTAVMPYVNEWREEQYRKESEALKQTSMSEVLVKALHEEITTRMLSLNTLRDDEMAVNRIELEDTQQIAEELLQGHDVLEQKLKDITAKYSQLEQALSIKTQEVIDLNVTLSQVISEKEDEKKAAERIYTELEMKLIEQTNHYKQAMTELKTEQTQRMTELNQDHHHSIEELKQSHSDIQEQLRADIDKLSNNLSTMTAQSSSQSETMGQLRAELENKASLKSTLDVLTIENRELEIKLHAAQQSVQSASLNVSKLEVELLDHKEQRNKAQTDLVQVNENYHLLNEKYVDLLSKKH